MEDRQSLSETMSLTTSLTSLRATLQKKQRSIARLLRERESKRLRTMTVESALQKNVEMNEILRSELIQVQKECKRIDTVKTSLLSTLREMQTACSVALTEKETLRSQATTLAHKLQDCR